jgi:hypothetical protein
VLLAAFATFLNESTDSFGIKRAHGVLRAAGVTDGVSFVAAAAPTVATAAAGWVRVRVVSIAGAEVYLVPRACGRPPHRSCGQGAAWRLLYICGRPRIGGKGGARHST